MTSSRSNPASGSLARPRQAATARSHRAPVQVGEGHLVRGHQAGAGAGFDGHVAEGHPGFHAHGAHGASGELQGATGAAGRADPADDVQDQVLGPHAFGQFALAADAEVAGPLLHQGLGGQDVLHLAGADTEGQRAEGAVGAGVAVAADDGGAGQGEALLGADDVDDALARVQQRDVGHPEGRLLAVLFQGLHLQAAGGVLDAGPAVPGGDVVVHHRQGGLGPAHRAPGQGEPFESLGAGHFVHQVAVDVEQRGAVLPLFHHVAVPEFVVQGARAHADAP